MRIELFPNPLKDRNYGYTQKAISILQTYGAELWLPKEAPLRDGVHRGDCPQPDMILVLGGDGSIIRAAHRAAKLKVPILGINLGRVGYLAEINVDEMERLGQIFTGDYMIEHRMMLEVIPMRNGVLTTNPRVALNDAVISHGRVSRLLDTEIICDGSSLGCYRSDGFIVTTPTGSTAYSLSAGGPILDPSLRGIGLTPICPHSLMARPILVSEESEIEIRYLSRTEETAHLTLDGEEAAELLPGDNVMVHRSSLTTPLVRMNREHKKSFFDILREKMSDI